MRITITGRAERTNPRQWDISIHPGDANVTLAVSDRGNPAFWATVRLDADTLRDLLRMIETEE